MIIYSADIQDFLKSCEDPMRLVTEIKGNLLDKFGIRVRDNEERSWMMSLPRVANLIKSSDKDFRKVLCEFNIPTSKQRIDFIILGKDKNGKPSAWVIELKQWSDVTEKSWNEFRVGQYTDSHPSFQASDYEFRLKEELGMNEKVNIKSSAYLFNLKNSESILFSDSYKEALEKARLYYSKDEHEMADDIESHTIIKDGAEAFEHFKDSKWSPTKKFIDLVEEDFDSIKLVGTQQIVYSKIEHFIKQWDKKDKMAFLISGNPGSGKTVVAFKLALLFIKHLQLNIQLMIPGQEVRAAFIHGMRDHKLSTIISGAQVRRNVDAAIIDEGHKAIARDTGIVNYRRNLAKLKFAIILIDDDQVINRKGITKSEVKRIAEEQGFNTYDYNIEETFRNGGERALIDWIDYVFYHRETTNGDFAYEQTKYVNKNQNYKLFAYKDDKSFVETYFDYHSKSVSRITSLWHQEFYEGPANEDGSVPRTVPIGSYQFAWNPNAEWKDKISPEDWSTYSKAIKNYANDRKQFLTGKPDKWWVAYFNHLQGYEFENIFVYIPNIFTYKNGEIIFHRDRLGKEVKGSQTWASNSKTPDENGRVTYELNKGYFLNRIKVMLTRGTKSTHVFAEDPALNKYIYDSIEQD